MATLALSAGFLDDLAGLEPRYRQKVSDLAAKFQQMTESQLCKSKGIHLEPHTNARDPRARTIRITGNLRGIVLDLGDAERFVLTRSGSCLLASWTTRRATSGWRGTSSVSMRARVPLR